ncbi:MAG: extracellular solute-binding protein [Deinococcota bacterium]|jgi:ABC-type glycerol-3-phosphate transport system substrate-binding protein|nr:extracellular solute-binding protein [Deinococcota bacterium]
MTAKTMLGLVLLLLLAWQGAGAQTLEMWTSSGEDRAYYQAMAERYREEIDPDFALTVNAYGFQEMPDRLSVAIRTGQNTPDIVQLEENFLGIYLGEEQVPFADLSERVREAGLGETIVEARLELFSYGGAVYGIPQSLSAVVLYYRHDLFEERGVDAEDIETWDDFVEVGQRLTGDRDGEYMIALDPSYWGILMRQRGVDAYDAEGNLQVSSDIAVDTLEWLVGLEEQGLATEPPRGTIFDPPFLTQMLAGDQVLTVIGADWFGLDFLRGITPQMAGQWRAMPLPRWPDDPEGRRTSSFSGLGLLIFGDSPHTDEAWGFIEYVTTSTEANVERYFGATSFTAYRPAWEDERLYQPDDYFAGQSLAALLREVADEVPVQHQAPGRARLLSLWNDSYWPAVIGGRQAPAEALEALARDLQR